MKGNYKAPLTGFEVTGVAVALSALIIVVLMASKRNSEAVSGILEGV